MRDSRNLFGLPSLYTLPLPRFEADPHPEGLAGRELPDDDHLHGDPRGARADQVDAGVRLQGQDHHAAHQEERGG